MLSALTKTKRLEVLRSRFKERIQQTSSDVRSYYAHLEGEDSESLRRLVHRDLTALTDEGFIKVFDEEDPILEVTGELPAGKRALYVIAAARENDVLGIGALRALAGDLLCSKSIAGALRMEAGFCDIPNTHSLTLALEGGVVSLVIEKADLPLRLIISRRIEGIHTEALMTLEDLNWNSSAPANRKTKRLALLLLPVTTLTAFRDIHKPGHLAIDFLPDGLQIIDLKSRNKTLIEEIRAADLQRLSASTMGRKTSTATQTWSQQAWLGQSLVEIAPLIPVRVASPILIQASKELKMIVR